MCDKYCFQMIKKEVIFNCKKQNVEKKTKTIKSANARASFLGDLNHLSNAVSEECFNNVVKLFKSKWRAIPDATVAFKHFEKDWLNDRLSRFYRGAAEGYAMNNNGLEATYKTLKDNASLHEQMPVHSLTSVTLRT